MIGSALFVTAFTIEGWFRHGYSARSMFVSELSLGERGWVQVVNFAVFGLLFLLFARGVAAEFPEGKASKAGPVLLAVIGVSLLVSGPLVMDPASTPRALMSWHGKLHGLFGAFVFSLSPVSCFVFLRRFREDPRWRSFRGWTLAASIIITAAVVTMSIGPARPPAPPNALNDWKGLLQRAVLVPYFVWVFTFALGLSSRRRTASSPQHAAPR